MALSLGTLLIVCVSTALGCYPVLSFVRSQVAAIFVDRYHHARSPPSIIRGFLYPI